MEKRKGNLFFIFSFLIFLSLAFASANVFDDLWSSFTGKIIEAPNPAPICVDCAAPPLGCHYENASCSTCGTLVGDDGGECGGEGLSLCGNGVQDIGEQCDGKVWANGASCQYFGYTSGVLGCDSNCKFDFSGCKNGNFYFSGTYKVSSGDKFRINGVNGYISEVSWALQGDTRPIVDFEAENAQSLVLHEGETGKFMVGAVTRPLSYNLSVEVVSIDKTLGTAVVLFKSIYEPLNLTTCVDSDGGNNILIPGAVTSGGVLYKDTCLPDGKTIKEYSCSNGIKISSTENCALEDFCVNDSFGQGYCSPKVSISSYGEYDVFTGEVIRFNDVWNQVSILEYDQCTKNPCSEEDVVKKQEVRFYDISTGSKRSWRRIIMWETVNNSINLIPVNQPIENPSKIYSSVYAQVKDIEIVRNGNESNDETNSNRAVILLMESKLPPVEKSYCKETGEGAGICKIYKGDAPEGIRIESISEEGVRLRFGEDKNGKGEVSPILKEGEEYVYYPLSGSDKKDVLIKIVEINLPSGKEDSWNVVFKYSFLDPLIEEGKSFCRKTNEINKICKAYNKKYIGRNIFIEEVLKNKVKLKVNEKSSPYLETGESYSYKLKEGEYSIRILNIFSSDKTPKNSYVKFELSKLSASIEECKEGCFSDERCYPLGYRKNGDYCSESNEFISQISGDGSCDNNFQCSSNLCVNSSCVSEGFLQKILNWFSRLFG